ncbi:hypothetical protein F5148DRAFT_1145534 [Russula earlei]|uniref:Uncharacterized protein n=1 Tax=Russula earlei TaxID=71964 RepID=A0ACC0UNK2_9AGAM|nr:hypothetical protein F5148DRAFT_1145534 [Russula earlei]
MVDSFADLWNSSAPVKPVQPARKLGASPASSSSAPRQKYDTFSMLAASSSNSSSPRSLTPSSNPPVPGQRSNRGASATNSGDAFGDLLSGSFGIASDNSKLTMAERAAKSKAQVQQPVAPVDNSTAWAGLDSLAKGASFSSTPAASKLTSSGIDDDWLFGSSISSAKAESASASKPLTDVRGIGSRQMPSGGALPEPSFQEKSLWDLNFKHPFERDTAVIAQIGPPSRSDTPGDFDFGDREDALLDDVSGSDDDILGDLGRPVHKRPAERPVPPEVSPSDRKSSPPPHLIGQIVEMGFSPDQARTALASTETGLDVQAALEMLLSDAPRLSPALAEQTSSGGSQSEHRHFQDYDGCDDQRHDSDPSQPRPQHRSYPSQERPPSSSSETNYQQQADKIISQASKIGAQLFQQANSFWKEGKSRVQKAYEERGATSLVRPVRYNEGQDGRPRWMREDLDENQPVQSKERPLPVQTRPLRIPSPVRLSERQVISASLSAISASAQHKASGTEMFKLGRFAEAEVAYTSAISQLPDSHLLLVPLLNNRGLSRLKTGNMSGTIEDCTSVITIVGPSYHPAREAKVTREEDGAGVDLGDGLIKAWRRRAEAYEGKEKWVLARQDWESIVGAEFAGKYRDEALSGIGRCGKMLNVDNASDGAAPSAPRASAPTRPTTRPRRGPTPPSEALARLKQANQEAEAEEQARHELKDSVDSRLAAWKNGKEANLRALVASLDTVLWPELGWQKVGMAELVTLSQVKIRYTKAIAKLHPDKLNVNNTTLEQRMIANGVFGALNDAWNAFKP